MKFNRREVLKGGLSALGFLALPGGLFAAPVGWKPKKKPNLVFGVVSDTHMRCHYDGKRFYSRYDVFYDDQALVEVMKLFKKAGVDAILHCGKADHALLVRVYDDMVRISRIWVNVKPKHVLGSLGPDWVMPLSGFTPKDHPLREENYVKVIGSPEFPKGAKLEVSQNETVLRIKIPKADGNPASLKMESNAPCGKG